MRIASVVCAHSASCVRMARLACAWRVLRAHGASCVRMVCNLCGVCSICTVCSTVCAACAPCAVCSVRYGIALCLSGGFNKKIHLVTIS